MDDLTRAWQHLVRGVRSLDAKVFADLASRKGRLLDVAMPALTDVADRSVLWIGIAGAMTMPDRPRLTRGAVRGLASIAATSLITNGIAKRVHWRDRPVEGIVPDLRRGRRRPTSSSFPSGHAASAAAFATGVAMESRAAGAIMYPLAAAVGLSRVVTGAHYPSDVLAGFALGSLVARIGGIGIPPLGPDPSVGHQAAVIDTGRRPRGQGVVIVVNSRSGLGGHARMLARIRRSLPEAEIVECGPGEDLGAAMAAAAERAEVLGAVGGDGTIGCAAAERLRTGRPLAVFPGGTFNHFSRALGASTAGQQIRALQAGTATRVDVAYLNDRLFLNTASVGVYTQFVRFRERLQASMPKPLAMLIASVATLRRGRAIDLTWAGRTHRISLAFFGNSQYLPAGFAPAARPRIDDGLIDIRLLEQQHGPRALWTLVCLFVGRLRSSGAYHEMAVPGIEITSDRLLTVARDGELGERTRTLNLHVDAQALTVLSPIILARLRRRQEDRGA